MTTEEMEENQIDPIEEAAMQWYNSVKYKSDLSASQIEGFKAGVKWANKTMIDRACEWLYRKQWGFLKFEIDIDDFRQAMEE